MGKKAQNKSITHSQIVDVLKSSKARIFERASHYYDSFYYDDEVKLWSVGSTMYSVAPRKELYALDDLNVWFQEILDKLSLGGDYSGRFQWIYVSDSIEPCHESSGYTWARGIKGIRMGYAGLYSVVGTCKKAKTERYTFHSEKIRDAEMQKRGFVYNKSKSALSLVVRKEPSTQKFVECISIVPYLSEKHFDEESAKDKKDFDNKYYPFRSISRSYNLNKFSSFLTYPNKKRFDRHCLAKAKYIVDNLGKDRRGDGKPILIMDSDDLLW